MALLATSSDGEILTIHFTAAKILDASVIQQIQEEVIAVVGKTEERNVLLDFSAVKFLSSAALGMLVRVLKKCKEFKVALALCGISPTIREVFTITGLDKVFDIYPDAEQAIRGFSKKSGLFR